MSTSRQATIFFRAFSQIGRQRPRDPLRALRGCSSARERGALPRLSVATRVRGRKAAAARAPRCTRDLDHHALAQAVEVRVPGVRIALHHVHTEARAAAATTATAAVSARAAVASATAAARAPKAADSAEATGSTDAARRAHATVATVAAARGHDAHVAQARTLLA